MWSDPDAGKISEMEDASLILTGEEYVEVLQNGANRRLQVKNIINDVLVEKVRDALEIDEALVTTQQNAQDAAQSATNADLSRQQAAASATTATQQASNATSQASAAQAAKAATEALFGGAVALDEAVQLSYANRVIIDLLITTHRIQLIA